ncbi:hypothetical protein BDN72DRAFT_176708 [Pluteus cervinus]|uniref:Uncharacterized protein n=1 Tax=Pluteus cervinus TaxID=181527 RepID=A0ACD3AIY8_9AGAR|nr:hypothetical protein BDN72DRAFT_176708 [Pluteus cervinus]
MFLCIQVFFSISFVLHPFKTAEFRPRFVPCLLQAMFVYAAPSTANWTLLALVVEVYVMMQTSGCTRWKLNFFLLCVPMTVFISEIAVVLIMGLRSPSSIGMQSDSLYCHLTIAPRSAIVSVVFYLLPVVICIMLFSLIGLKAYRYSQVLQVGRENTISPLPVSSILRVGILLLAPVPALGFAFPDAVYALRKLNRLLPLVPLLTAIAFGTQKDIVLAMRFRGSS